MTGAPSRLVLLTGLSGSGKSVVLNALEDADYFCVDNLPPALLQQLVESLLEKGETRMAAAIDARTGVDLEGLTATLEHLRSKGINTTVLFLTARPEILLQRYSETRRRHPLSHDDAGRADEEGGGRSLRECIELEQDLMAGYADLGMPLDTSDLKSSALRSWVRELLTLKAAPLTLSFQSFAYKEGIPLDADLVFDARCLPNPFYEPKLRELTGKDKKVVDFLKSHASVDQMVDEIDGYLQRWLPHYQKEQRSYLTVAVGCTGGQHRSVYCCEALANRFRENWPVLVRHRSLMGRGLD